MSELAAIQNTLIGFTKRAEKATEDSLVATFVDSAPLFALLSTTNNQVIYGRRGTGKTHALKVLAEHVERNGDYPVFVDMRTVGSNGSIYSDTNRPLGERASTLLTDALHGLLHEFYSLAVRVIEQHLHPNEITRRLDAFQEAISTIRISGDVTSDDKITTSSRSSSGGTLGVTLNKEPSIQLNGSRTSEKGSSREASVRRTGHEHVHITFGTIANTMADLVDILGGKRIWLLIDEWSEIPVDLQPYLADLFRRAVLPVNAVTVKIAAIEHRSNFTILKDRGEYIGLELGADVSADLNLDDFLVFDNSQEKAVSFIGDLIFRHYQTAPTDHPELSTPDSLITSLFTQRPVFEEFVRAVEGVPRDALNLIAKVVTKAYGQQIAMSHVRAGARDWYNQDKSAVIRGNNSLSDLMHHIIAEVIGTRRARAFLLKSSVRFTGVDQLFDARLLHILKKNVSTHNDPGVRYDVYKIDYGCYVDLINTTKAPEGLFEANEGEYQEVPKDDYRSIRRAILDPRIFLEEAAEQEATVTMP